MKSHLIAIVAGVLVVGCATTQPPEPDRALLKAANTGNIEAVKQHLADGVDVDAKDVAGMTPLHAAAFTGRMEVVELLIENGADVNAKNDEGGTPLDWAETVFEDFLPEAKPAKNEIADLLRKHGGKTGEELKAEEK